MATAGVTEPDGTSVGLSVRLELAHAALQHLAGIAGVDLLHVKGLAFDPPWRSRGIGSDADVLVRPSQVGRFLPVLQSHGWRLRSRFHTGSPFGHAQTYWHDHLGYADVHRFFPGMSHHDDAFDVLWHDRGSVELAATPCPVPDETGQALIFALNQARNGADDPPDERVQALLVSDVGDAVAALVPRVGAEVGWAAARGKLATVRDHREHDLWRAITQGTGRLDEWRARVKAEPSLTGKALVVLRAPLVNTEHLANTRGHRPTPLEIGIEFVDRPRRAVLEVWRARREGRRQH